MPDSDITYPRGSFGGHIQPPPANKLTVPDNPEDKDDGVPAARKQDLRQAAASVRKRIDALRASAEREFAKNPPRLLPTDPPAKAAADARARIDALRKTDGTITPPKKAEPGPHSLDNPEYQRQLSEWYEEAVRKKARERAKPSPPPEPRPSDPKKFDWPTERTLPAPRPPKAEALNPRIVPKEPDMAAAAAAARTRIDSIRASAAFDDYYDNGDDDTYQLPRRGFSDEPFGFDTGADERIAPATFYLRHSPDYPSRAPDLLIVHNNTVYVVAEDGDISIDNEERIPLRDTERVRDPHEAMRLLLQRLLRPTMARHLPAPRATGPFTAPHGGGNAPQGPPGGHKFNHPSGFSPAFLSAALIAAARPATPRDSALIYAAATRLAIAKERFMADSDYYDPFKRGVIAAATYSPVSDVRPPVPMHSEDIAEFDAAFDSVTLGEAIAEPEDDGLETAVDFWTDTNGSVVGASVTFPDGSTEHRQLHIGDAVIGWKRGVALPKGGVISVGIESAQALAARLLDAARAKQVQAARDSGQALITGDGPTPDDLMAAFSPAAFAAGLAASALPTPNRLSLKQQSRVLFESDLPRLGPLTASATRYAWLAATTAPTGREGVPQSSADDILEGFGEDGFAELMRFAEEAKRLLEAKDVGPTEVEREAPTATANIRNFVSRRVKDPSMKIALERVGQAALREPSLGLLPAQRPLYAARAQLRYLASSYLASQVQFAALNATVASARPELVDASTGEVRILKGRRRAAL